MIKISNKFTLFLFENFFKSVIKTVMHTFKSKNYKIL